MKTEDLETRLAETGRLFYQRGWATGTSGNFSTVITRDPLRLLITASGVDKGALTPAEILEIDEHSQVLAGEGRPSDEAKLHLAVVRSRKAGAVLHTHSVWSTLLSGEYSRQGGFEISGLEMLKGLSGVRTHTHKEWIPIIDNSQDMGELSGDVEAVLSEHPGAHAFVLNGHGLYTWGRDLSEAKRHIEILEFLFEVSGRKLWRS
jgi:methylthioribulose-1-phosphate dehydratase